MQEEGLSVRFRLFARGTAFYFGSDGDTGIQEVSEEIKVIFPFPRFDINDLPSGKSSLLIQSILSLIDCLQR